MKAVGPEFDRDQMLWRYFKTARFSELMDTGRMYFAAARQFQDKFEGAVAIMPPDFPADPRYAELEGSDRAFEELRRLTKISCWHRATHESDAMWQLYAEDWKGVAICSTPSRLQAALQPFRLHPTYGVEDVFCGEVTYVDLLHVRLKPTFLDRFLVKHIAFSWEREFRLMISLRMAEEFGVSVPEAGILVDVDLHSLVEHIVIGPLLPSAEHAAVVEAASRHGLADRIQKSSLLGRPRFI
jgi:hypothetical protein